MTQNDIDKDYQVGETALIGLGDKHRMANPSDSEDMILIEVQTGTYFGEDDIVRIEDDYKKRMSEIKELWELSWADGICLTILLMLLYTYKVWIDNKFKK